MKKIRQHNAWMRPLLLSLLLVITGHSVWGDESYTITPDTETAIPIWEENIYVEPGEEATLFVWEMKEHGKTNIPYRWYRRWYLGEGTGTIDKIDTEQGLEQASDGSFFWHHKLHLSDGDAEPRESPEAERAAQIKYTMPSEVEEDFVDTVICDISINDNGTLDKTNHTLTEPTLSKRYKFIIRPASVIANQIKDNGPEKYTIETPKGTTHVNLQMALSSENYYWYDSDNTALQSCTGGKLYYQVGENGTRTVGKDGETEITNSPLISIDIASGLTEETTVYVYGNETTNTELAEFTLIPQENAGFMFEETLKENEDTCAYRMPISHPELFEEIGYYDFDLDNVADNLTNNNSCPDPMDPSITSYAFVYPLKASLSDKVVPFQNQYGLYRTAMLSNISDKNVEVQMEDNTTKKYSWYLPDNTAPIYDRTYLNSPTEDKRYGYFYYIDASLEAGRIVNVPITGYICGGTELVVTAWINNMTSSKDITVPNINMYLIGENVNEKDEVTESEILHRFSSGNSIAELAKWQQLYYRVTLPFDKVDKYNSYRLEVVNNALNSNGNDFAIDDVRIFRTVPRAEARQGNSLCDEEVSEISISMDYEKLLTMLGLHENDDVPTEVQPADDVWNKVEGHENISDKNKYRKVQYWVYSISDKWKTADDLQNKNMVEGDETSGKLTDQELYISDQVEGDEEATYRLNYDVLDRIQGIRINNETSKIFADCFEAANLFYDVKEHTLSESGTAVISTVTSKMRNEGYTTDALAAYTDDGTVIFQNVGFPDKGAESDFYIVYVPTEANVESGFQNLNDRCSMITPFKLKKAEDIVTVVDDDDTETEMDIDDIEGGNTYTLTGHFSARESIEADPIEVEEATFDWFFGSRTEFEDPKEGIEYNGKMISIQEALSEYHTSGTNQHSNDILNALKTKFEKDAVKEWKEESNPTGTTLNTSEVKLVLHAKEIKIKTEEGLNNMPLMVTPNPSTYEDLTGDEEGDGLLYCVAPREIWLGGETHIVPGDPELPSLVDNWGIRLGMGQIKDMIGDEGETSSTSLRIPIYDIQPANDQTRDFQIIEENTGIQVVATTDDTYQETSETENPENPSEITGQDIVANITQLKIPTTGEMTWSNAYVEIQFNDKAMNFREGFEYKLRIPFGEEITIDGSDDGEKKLLEGTFDLLLKIVPEYVVWTGSTDGQRNWNNDEHWKRATAADLYDEDGSRAEQYHEDVHYDDAYAPMYFTNVIIQNGEDGGAYSAYPYLYELKDKDDETDGLLNMEVTEDMDNVIGDATENIEYDLMVDPRYEKVYETPKGTGIDAYTCVRFYGNRCDSIHFKPETELLHAEYLAYEHASIDYELDPNRWYTLASPLQGVVAGDMYLPTEENKKDIPYARQETPLFEDITFSTDNYSRWNPAVYMRGWDKSGEGTVVTPEGNGIKYALEGSWSNLYNKVDEPFTPGTGFSIGVDADMTDSKKVMFRLPKADEKYLYYPQGTGEAGHETEITRSNVGKLIKVDEEGLPTNATTESYQLIGNPFMAHLDMKEVFGNENSTGTYYILGKDGTETTIYGTEYSISTSAENSDKVAPLQSFITDKSITFTNDMQTTATSGQPTLRAATKSLPEIRLTAERDGKRGTTVVAYLPSASENYLQGEDAMLLADKEQNAPQIYTLSANNRMLAINLTETIEDIPVGIYGTDESPVVLHVQTSGEWGDAVLYDKELKKSYPLQGDVTLNVPGNTSGRYFLRAGTPTANETIATGDIQIYSLSGNRVMVTATTPLKDIRVYDMGGAVVKHVKAGVCSFELYLANGIYVVTAENAEGETETAKVVVR